MGFEVEDYPIILHTALSTDIKTTNQVHEAVQATYQSCAQKLIFPLFSNDYLHQLCKQNIQNTTNLLDLDRSLVPSDSYYKKQYYHLFMPLVNQTIWQKSFSSVIRDRLMRTIAGYSSFLNLKSYLIKIKFEASQNQSNNDLIINGIVQCLNNCRKHILSSGSRMVIMIQLDGSGQDEGNTVKNNLIWNYYIELRKSIVKIFPKSFNFDLSISLPGNLPNSLIINRWKSQGLNFVMIREDCFLQNHKGFRILPAKHERIILELCNLKTSVIIHSNNVTKKTSEYFKYLEHVFSKKAINTLKSQKDALNLTDFLQDPLQPYADNLQSLTYQIFQNDTIKYDEYQGALEEALLKFSKTQKIVIYYIGAGRGGLLFNAFAAAKKKQRKIYVYCIQKNPYPIQTIKQRIKDNKWGNNVKLVQSDIRDYQMPQKPNIFMSELLGGFGDNQLSPECLCWAQKNISEDTICIPQSYHSYIRPISYQAIHRMLPQEARHVYYTVNFGNYFTNFQSKMVWEFVHPLKEKQKSFNQVSDWIKFTSKTSMIINGFAGYFTTHLYGIAQLSILPQRPTLGSYSWFPLYFPFDKQIQVNTGDDIQIKMVRNHTEKGVWYEWQYRFKGQQSIIHNKDGFKIVIQL